MLVLTRKKSEAVVLCTENAGVYTLLGVVYNVENRGGGPVRFGFHFDPSIKVIRLELTEFDGMSVDQLSRVKIGTQVKYKSQ